jgi:hypothetical protein
MHGAAWASIPSQALIGTQDQVIPPAELTFMAQRASSHITVRIGVFAAGVRPEVEPDVDRRALTIVGVRNRQVMGHAVCRSSATGG